MILHLKITGILLIALSLIHIAFPKYFNWKKELVGISLINRQMMYAHTFFIALVLLLTGILCVVSAKAITETQLGNRLALGLFIFWFFRLMIQFFGYSAKLWKGKMRETVIHVVISLLWSYICIVFFIVYWSTRNI
ncbi:MAG TPA: hypothetical protein VKI61_08785 [Chitinophagaceae bacterium]|jgi:hypothetical protein|nr:hypothetical protein [Chitinophagaceae bacterium]